MDIHDEEHVVLRVCRQNLLSRTSHGGRCCGRDRCAGGSGGAEGRGALQEDGGALRAVASVGCRASSGWDG